MSRLALSLSLVAVAALGPFAAGAPPVAGQVAPDSLPFGTLHTGGVAEGSFLVFAPPDDPKPKVKIEAPKFVKVLSTQTFTRDVAPGTVFNCVVVEVALDTAKSGNLKGDIKVTVGELVAKLPISATVKERKRGTPRLLVVGTPFHSHSTGDAKVYKQWTDLVAGAGWDVSYTLRRHRDTVLGDIDLGRYGTVLMSPGALIGQSREDVKRLRTFAEGGGRLVVAANSFYMNSVKGANAVLDGYGLTILDEQLPHPAGTITLGKDDLAADVAKVGVTSAKFYRGSPVTVEKSGRVLAAAVGFKQPGMGYAAIATAGKGEVVALGESLWCAWVSEKRAGDSDNAKLLRFLLNPPARE